MDSQNVPFRKLKDEPEGERGNGAEGSGGDENDRVESDPQNTYLQVGQWIAQWDAPYEAWYYYNSQSVVSTWTKPTELEGIEFTDPVPDIKTAKENVKAAHQAMSLPPGASPGANTVRDERDKPFDPFGVDNKQPSSSLTNHNSLSIGPPVTSSTKSTSDEG